MPSPPQVGALAPDFTLDGTSGSFTLSQHRGERIVLLFYPGDDTTVCTKQFCSYRDDADEINELGARLVGISVQGMESKAAFRGKYGLTTELLADPDGRISALYGVYSKRFKMAKRTMFIVDEDGRIAHEHGRFMSLTFDNVDDIRAALEQAR